MYLHVYFIFSSVVFILSSLQIENLHIVKNNFALFVHVRVLL